MWIVSNETPYAADRNWTRDRQGNHVWLVAVQATFDIAASGRLTLADEQPPPLLAPEYRGEPGASSLRRDSDLLAAKPGTDVLMDACAYAPKGRAVPIVPVTLRVADVDKSVLVHGSRVYYRGALGLTTSRPQPFVTHPVHYEEAFGGVDVQNPDPRKQRIDPRNPVGRGFTLTPRALEHALAHALEYPGGKPADAGPAAFGPIDYSWSPRLERAGTYDESWLKTRRPLLPEDYDEAFALTAPEDQRPTRPLRGGEVVAVTNATPEGLLRFELPKIFLTFTTRISGRDEEHRAPTLSTVFLALEERKLSLVWQSTLAVSGRELDELDDTTVGEKAFLT
jgi:hypothetical protein